MAGASTTGLPPALLLSPEVDPKDLLAGRHEDLGQLGRGGMGEVRLVKDRVLNRRLALKILTLTDPGFTERFLEEAQLTAQLTHPGVVPVHDLGCLEDGRRPGGAADPEHRQRL